MLGFNYPRKPVSGEFAKKIREAADCAATRNYNENDAKTIQRQRQVLAEHNVIWDFGAVKAK